MDQNIDQSNRRIKGVVTKWFHDGRYGFITAERMPNGVYVNYKDIRARGPRELYPNEPVEFSVEEGDRGLIAREVRVFQSRFRIERWADISNFSKGALVDKLASMSGEAWDYRNTKTSDSHPVLRNYILYTFERLLEVEAVCFSEGRNGRRLAIANTGLATDLQQEIYALFEEAKPYAEGQSWVLQDFVEPADKRVAGFAHFPEAANYFDDPSDLLYDTRRPLRVNYEHIIRDNLRRFPMEYHSNQYSLRNILESAVRAAEKRVKRNYKAAIPQFFQGNLQLLLPLCLTDPSKADLALVVTREAEVYIGSTVLPLDMAYNNARLIARPDREWLEP